jgi:hypothetical protein
MGCRVSRKLCILVLRTRILGLAVVSPVWPNGKGTGTIRRTSCSGGVKPAVLSRTSSSPPVYRDEAVVS